MFGDSKNSPVRSIESGFSTLRVTRERPSIVSERASASAYFTLVELSRTDPRNVMTRCCNVVVVLRISRVIKDVVYVHTRANANVTGNHVVLSVNAMLNRIGVR